MKTTRVDRFSIKWIGWMLLLVMLTGCASAPPGTPTLPPTTTPRPSLQPGVTLTVGNCELQPIVKPTRPAVIPGYAQLDESTGLHMTGDVQNIDLADYQLKVTGKIDHPLTLTYDELRCLPKLTATPALICRGYFEDFAEWSGASLEYLLGMVGVQKDASSVYLVSEDGYEAFLTLEEAMREDNFLAYEWEEQPLPIFHGFPIRAVIPSMLGNKWTKWLIEIRVE